MAMPPLATGVFTTNDQQWRGGHFNGVPMTTREAADLSPNHWIAAVTDATTSFALALPNKAIAVEVHTVLEDSTITETIIHQLWDDPQLDQRVGAAL